MTISRYVPCCVVAIISATPPMAVAARSQDPSDIGELARLVVGLDQSGASAAQAKQKFFLNLFLSVPFVPLTRQSGFLHEHPVRLWGDVRIASVPQQITAPVREFADQFNERLGEIAVNEIAQSGEFIIGLDWMLGRTQPSGSESDLLKFFSVHLFAAFGASTPLDPKETIEVFRTTPEVAEMYSAIDLVRDTLVAFVSPDRDQFFHQWFVGIRFKTHYQNRESGLIDRFPAILDLGFGQNSAVTGGILDGHVLRIDGFLPLPWSLTRAIHLFGSVQLRFGSAGIRDPLLLTPVADVAVPSPGVAVVTVPQIDRDFYRIGVGVNAVELFSQAGKAAKRIF